MSTVAKTSAVLGMFVLLTPGAPGEVVIETVVVGNANNAADTRYDANGIGGVDYVFGIGKYETTTEQYTEFLNAVAANDLHGLYATDMWTSGTGCKIQRVGTPGDYSYSVAAEWAARPVNWISWGDAARFANWMHNGQPTGPQDLTTTEDGSYFLNGAVTNTALLAVTREPTATWVIPSLDEWYKAAYHKNDGVTGDYFDYPTGSDVTPSNDLIDPDPGNNANWEESAFDWTIGSPYWRTVVGEFENSASPYGTFDQGGNVFEWNEYVSGSQGQMRGGFFDGQGDLHANVGSAYPRTNQNNGYGIRLALVGDEDGDGVVNVADVCSNTPSGIPVASDGRPLGDIDDDCDVDVGDFAVLQQSFTGPLGP